MQTKETPGGVALSDAATSSTPAWKVHANTTHEVVRYVIIVALVAVLALVGFVLAMPLDANIPLGPDFGSSVEATLSAAALSGDEAPTQDQLGKAATVMQARLNAYGVRDSRTTATGDGLKVNLRLVGDVQRLSELITRTGTFELVEVDRISDAESIAKIRSAGAGTMLTPGSYVALLTNDDLVSVTASQVASDDASQPSTNVLSFEFGGEGKRAFAEVTSKLARSGGLLAFVVDNVVVAVTTVPSVMLDGKVSVGRGLSEFETRQTAAVLQGGKLPVALTSAGSTQVSPTLGAAGLPVTLALVALGAVVVLVLFARRSSFVALVCALGVLEWVLLVLGGLSLACRAGILYFDAWACIGLVAGLVSFLLWGRHVLKGLTSAAAQELVAQDAADEALRHTFDVRTVAFIAVLLLALLGLVLVWPLWLLHVAQGLSLGMFAGLVAQLGAHALVRLGALSSNGAFIQVKLPPKSAQQDEGPQEKPKAAKKKQKRQTVAGGVSQIKAAKARKAKASQEHAAESEASSHE